MFLTIGLFRIPDAFYLLVLMCIVQVGQSILGLDFAGYGILPRTPQGLWHIPFAPWIHHGSWHLARNAIPFVLLGWLIQSKDRLLFWEVMALLVVVGGLGTWIFGSSGYHAGASGVVLGFWAFLLADAYYSHAIRNIVMATLVVCLYGGLITSLVDLRPHISWVGHVCGMLAGVLAARLANIKQT